MSPAIRKQVSKQPWIDLLIEVLRRTPKLDGALCVGRAHVFEAADAEHVDQALVLYQRCPALPACSSWFASLPASRRPRGVIAGRHRRELKSAAAQHDSRIQMRCETSG